MARLFRRLFERGLEYCPKRGGELEVIAAILTLPGIEWSLIHVGPQASVDDGSPL